MITKIDHVGIAVEALDERLPFWADALGLDVDRVETVATEHVKVAFLGVGPSRIELLEPTDDESAIARFLAKRGPGIHHLTLEVADIERAVALLREREVPLLGEAPRPGAGGHSVAFIHPKAAGGVLVELVERTAASETDEADVRPGAAVLLYLREPQEKLWGVLRRLDASGVVLEGIDLSSFDDWLAQLDRPEETIVGPSVLFLPMSRLEKILLDRSTGQLPSLAERFERRTGRTIQELLSGGE